MIVWLRHGKTQAGGEFIISKEVFMETSKDIYIIPQGEDKGFKFGIETDYAGEAKHWSFDGHSLQFFIEVIEDA